MSRNYWRYILAAFGWLALVGASPILNGKGVNGQTDRIRAISEQRAQAASTIPEQDATPSPDTGCKKGQDKRESDLCAQWKAADAAFDAARAGEKQAIIGYIGLILGAVTMGAALAAALYAKRAAVATEATVGIARDAADGAGQALAIAARNADAALAQVEISREAASAQLRPYVFFSGTNESEELDFSPTGSLTFNVKNFGQLPSGPIKVFYNSESVTRPIGDRVVPLLPMFDTIGRLGPGDFSELTFNLGDMERTYLRL